MREVKGSQLRLRKIGLWLVVDGKDLWKSLEPYAVSVSFIDDTKDKTKSRLEVELADFKGMFSNDTEFLRKLWSAKVYAGVYVEGEFSFNFGSFQLKAFRGSYRDRLSLSFVSYSKDYRELRRIRNEHYENVSLENLARMLIQRAGFIPIIRKIPSVHYQKIELKHQSIEDFLKAEAKKYNLKFFVKGEKVAFGEFETKEHEVREITSLNFELEELKGVSKVVVEYWNGDRIIKYEHNTGKPGEVIYHVERVENEAQAKLVAERIAKKYNKRKGKVMISTYGQPIYAGEKVKLEKPKILKGTWEVERAVHRISKSEGWTLELELSPMA